MAQLIAVTLDKVLSPASIMVGLLKLAPNLTSAFIFFTSPILIAECNKVSDVPS